MKISFDLDGTAWKYRTFFRELAWGLKARGHQVGILTGHNNSLEAADLRLWEARGFPPADFIVNAGTGNLEGDAREWKMQRVRAHGIDAHVDDWSIFDKLELVIQMPSEENL